MKEKKNLRKVDYFNGTSHEDAYFHEWGTTVYTTDKMEEFQITVGIIELEDDQVVEAEPALLKFEDDEDS